MLKLKMMLCVMMCAAGRRLHIKAVCRSVREATASAWIMQPPPDYEPLTAEQDYSTLRERLITMQKQLEGKVYYEQCR